MNCFVTDPMFDRFDAGQLERVGESTTGYAFVANSPASHLDPLGLHLSAALRAKLQRAGARAIAQARRMREGAAIGDAARARHRPETIVLALDRRLGVAADVVRVAGGTPIDWKDAHGAGVTTINPQGAHVDYYQFEVELMESGSARHFDIGGLGRKIGPMKFADVIQDHQSLGVLSHIYALGERAAQEYRQTGALNVGSLTAFELYYTVSRAQTDAAYKGSLTYSINGAPVPVDTVIHHATH